MQGSVDIAKHEEQADEDDPHRILPAALALEHRPDEEQRQRIEQQQLQVKAHRGMLREEHQCEHDAAQSAEHHQEGVEPAVGQIHIVVLILHDIVSCIILGWFSGPGRAAS